MQQQVSNIFSHYLLVILNSKKNVYLGVLLENHTVSTLSHLGDEDGNYFKLYYYSGRDGDVDIIIQGGFQSSNPIDVSMGKKSKKRSDICYWML